MTASKEHEGMLPSEDYVVVNHIVYNSDMTLVLAMKRPDSITVVADGLSRAYDDKTGKEVEPDTGTLKVVQFTDYCVFGYTSAGVSGDFINGVITGIFYMFSFVRNKTIKDVTKEIGRFLQFYFAKNKMTDSASMRMLVAGFDLDEDYRPTTTDFYIAHHTGKVSSTTENYLSIGADDFAPDIYKNKTNYRILTVHEAETIGKQVLEETAAKTLDVAGTLRVWNITKGSMKIEPKEIGFIKHRIIVSDE